MIWASVNFVFFMAKSERLKLKNL
jgi:hypothetical protein